jgi:hypothetical protein
MKPNTAIHPINMVQKYNTTAVIFAVECIGQCWQSAHTPDGAEAGPFRLGYKKCRNFKAADMSRLT